MPNPYDINKEKRDAHTKSYMDKESFTDNEVLFVALFLMVLLM